MIMHNKNRLITESQYHRRICLLPLIASSMLALWSIIMTIKTSVEENRMMFDYTDPMDLMVIIIGVSFPCLIYLLVKNDIRARLYKKKGVPINATIVAQTPLSGGERGQQIHLIIEFVEDGKKRKYYTQNYANDPDHALKSTACVIYKYRNRYIENDFSYRENDNDPYVKIPHMESINQKNRKEMEEFVN